MIYTNCRFWLDRRDTASSIAGDVVRAALVDNFVNSLRHSGQSGASEILEKGEEKAAPSLVRSLGWHCHDT